MSSVTYTSPASTVEAFPSADTPAWDAVCQEWVLTDSDGIHYFGDTPSQCYTQFHEALHHLARAAVCSGFDIAELRQFRRL